MTFLQASAGPVTLAIGEAGLLDARAHRGGLLTVGLSVGSSSHTLKASRVLSATATGHNDGSTDYIAVETSGASSGVLASTGVDWPFYWVSMTSSGASTSAVGYVALL